jgi:hypothetical protein
LDWPSSYHASSQHKRTGTATSYDRLAQHEVKHFNLFLACSETLKHGGWGIRAIIHSLPLSQQLFSR